MEEIATFIVGLFTLIFSAEQKLEEFIKTSRFLKATKQLPPFVKTVEGIFDPKLLNTYKVFAENNKSITLFSELLILLNDLITYKQEFASVIKKIKKDKEFIVYYKDEILMNVLGGLTKKNICGYEITCQKCNSQEQVPPCNILDIMLTYGPICDTCDEDVLMTHFNLRLSSGYNIYKQDILKFLYMAITTYASKCKHHDIFINAYIQFRVFVELIR